MDKIAFVIPWYGKDIPGGAESACRNIVMHLQEKMINVEVLTTCVKDFSSDWNHNFHPEGAELVQGILVRRFRVRERDTLSFDQVNYKLMKGIPVTEAEEEIFLKEMINSPDLLEYIDSHSHQYRCFVFMPYMFGTTYWGSKVCPEKSVLMPCLHDESYARMKLIQEMFSNVKGALFLSQPEFELAHRLYHIKSLYTAVTGIGITTDFKSDVSGFRSRYSIHNPFILYAGRKDKGKNLPLLLRCFFRFKAIHPRIPLDLVLIGAGDTKINRRIEPFVHDLGFVSARDKFNAYGAAHFLCQPSSNESFSIVVMESWVSGRPVLVNQNCAVTSHFAEKSRAGLCFSNSREFGKNALFFLENNNAADSMGKRGRKFVLRNYTWKRIIKGYIKYFKKFPKG